MNLQDKIERLPLLLVFFLILVTLTAHFLFSSLGFNPTDDGFTLAYSKRIINGQIPHLDFIIIRPFLSPLIHIPFVLWGGDYTFLFSRLFVWFQFACISWIWTQIIIKKSGITTFSNFEKVSIALISFAFSVHSFPIIAWHTIDGLFLVSIGLSLCIKEKKTYKMTGYFLIGLAYLCKQSFIFTAPLVLIVLGDWRNIKYWLVIIFPGLIYLTFLFLTNSLNNAILQLSSQKDFLKVGILAYFNWKLILGVIPGFLSACLILKKIQIKLPFFNIFKQSTGLFILTVIPLIVIAITFISGKFIFATSFVLFGLLTGIIVCIFYKKDKKSFKQFNYIFLVLIIAWSISLSIGYNFPILASGQMFSVLFVFAYPKIRQKMDKKINKIIYLSALLIGLSLVLISFGVMRLHHIYRDLDSSNLSHKLDDTFPGGKGIKTNENTFKFIVDLNKAIRFSQDLGTSYSIIPDCAGWWVMSPQKNPLPIDWAQETELNTRELVNHVILELESKRNTNIVIVQKVKANSLAFSFTPLSDKYEVVNYVKDNFNKLDETDYFELYN